MISKHSTHNSGNSAIIHMSGIVIAQSLRKLFKIQFTTKTPILAHMVLAVGMQHTLLTNVCVLQSTANSFLFLKL